MKHLRVVTIVGTRPEVIRLSSVIKRLENSFEHKLIHTGQNYDYELNRLMFEDLELREPDVALEPRKSSLGEMIGDILAGTERALRTLKPDAVLVLGDTNSCLAAIMAKRLHIPVFHMEAGNRCFDENVPEETNRRIIDHIADFNLTYTEHARRNLLKEGIESRRIYVTGSPMREVLEHYRSAIVSAQPLSKLGLTAGKYVLVSTHREENVDNSHRLQTLMETLETVVTEFDVPVVVSAHPRLRKRLEGLRSSVGERIILQKPFGFIDYNNLQMSALCTLSDSGTISEEAAILGFPAVTIRTSIERPEAMDTGSIIVAGISKENVIPAMHLTISQWAAGQQPEVPEDYQIRNTSQRVVNLIGGLARMHSEWSGVRALSE